MNAMATNACMWRATCTEPALHPVWTETRPGLIVHLDVCRTHLAEVARRGYRTTRLPIPAPPRIG